MWKLKKLWVKKAESDKSRMKKLNIVKNARDAYLTLFNAVVDVKSLIKQKLESDLGWEITN